MTMEDVIQDIKKFNRFYINEMGVFDLYRDKNSYSATEAMILFEIGISENCTAAALSRQFLLDKGYISRIIGKLVKKGILTKVLSEEDRRIQYLKLTDKGGEDLRFLQARASSNVEEMIKGINSEDVSELIRSMKKIEAVLANKNRRG